MWHLLLGLLLLHCSCVHLSSSQCARLAPSSFTQEQKADLCGSNDSTGPALCALLAHRSLRYTYPAVLSLCSTALSDAPATCVLELKKARVEPHNGTAANARGDAASIDYCRGSRSGLPSSCFVELSKLSGKNKLSATSVYSFCHLLESEGPLVCIRAAIAKAALLAPQALAVCGDATNSDYNATSTCLMELVLLVDSAREGSQVERVALARYCSHTSAPLGRATGLYASAGASCYSSSSALSPALAPRERLQLCEAALVVDGAADGPVRCTRHALSTFNKQQGSSHALPVQQLTSLCARATGSGPSLCFDKSREFSAAVNSSSRLGLCVGASGDGPAVCFKQAFRGSAAVAESAALQLCSGASDDAPALCLAAAPRYLSQGECVALCRGAAAAAEPGACVRRVEQLLPSFRHGHRRILIAAAGAPQEGDAHARAAAVAMCAFGGAAPLASAQCLKDAPRSMELLDALLMCRAGGCAASCAAAARGLSSQEVAALCTGASCAAGAKAALCAAQLLPSALPRSAVVRLCGGESERGGALACALSALGGGAAGSPHVIARVCTAAAAGAEAEAIAAGQCVARAYASYGSAMEDDVAAHLCSRADPLGLLSCLGALRGPVVLHRDVDACAAERAEPVSAKVVELLSEDDTQRITAGRRFSLLLQLFDQWGRRAGERSGCRAGAAIDAGNAQGAVLWGAAPNASSAQGRVRLSNLMITQPGTVQLRLYCSESGRVLAVLSTSVAADPRAGAASEGCAQLFSLLSSAADGGMERGEGSNSTIRGHLPDSAYLLALGCSSTLHEWRVSLHCSPCGPRLCWLEHRMGLSALWTGVGLPSADALPERRLLLPEGWRPGSSEGRAVLRKAYRQASLLWHPDRWAERGFERYGSAVKAAFQAVAEAYESLEERAVV